MKKILILLVSLFLICSCSNDNFSNTSMILDNNLDSVSNSVISINSSGSFNSLDDSSNLIISQKELERININYSLVNRSESFLNIYNHYIDSNDFLVYIHYLESHSSSNMKALLKDKREEGLNKFLSLDYISISSKNDINCSLSLGNLFDIDLGYIVNDEGIHFEFEFDKSIVILTVYNTLTGPISLYYCNITEELYNDIKNYFDENTIYLQNVHDDEYI